jgi:hypothetical protein
VSPEGNSEVEGNEIPTTREIKRRVELALSVFRECEAEIIARNPSERSLTHRLAVHLESSFPGWNVDCEFNRIGTIPKKVHMYAPSLVGTASEEAITVFPDIIVHRRGEAGPNLLVIEAKKATSQIGDEFDKLKLTAYKRDLAYKYAAFIVLPAGRLPGKRTQWL